LDAHPSVATFNPVLVLDCLDKLETSASESKPDHVIELIPVQDEIGFTTSGEDAA
jgi:hypothetical protein